MERPCIGSYKRTLLKLTLRPSGIARGFALGNHPLSRSGVRRFGGCALVYRAASRLHGVRAAGAIVNLKLIYVYIV